MYLVAIAALFVACAEPAPPPLVYGYRPRGADGFGCSELQMDERTCQVSFVGRSFIEAREGAMRRAAEVTLGRGFDGFVIAASEDFAEEVTRRRFLVGRVRRRLPTTVITIQMLRQGDADGGQPVYDAHLVVQSQR
jgi:hypothetical protein